MLTITIWSEIEIPQLILDKVIEALTPFISHVEVFDIDLSEVIKKFYNTVRGQVDASKLLDYLEYTYPSSGFLHKQVFVVDEDAYVKGLNYVLGVARYCGSHAIVFTPRLRQEFWNLPPSEEIFLSRLCKEIVHELGHTLCLDHCLNPRCVMRFSNSVFETDEKDYRFCNRCKLKIEHLFQRKLL